MSELEELFKILRGEDKESPLYRKLQHDIIQERGEIYQNELKYRIALEVQNIVLEKVLKQNGINILK